jgi:hypothetical protein
MSEAPKRLVDDATALDPDLAAQLRSDLRVAGKPPSAYDVEGGLARLSAAIAGGSSGGGGHQGGGAGPGAAATGGGALGVKLGIAGLVALGALGGALLLGSAPNTNTKIPPRDPESAPVTIPVPVVSSAPVIEETPPAVELPAARASAAPAGPRASAGASVKPEMDQLAETRRALASDPGRALALADEGHARFPRGVFWQEREMAAIQALLKLGHTADAKARARAFVARHPESPFAEGLRALSGSD